MSNVTLSIGGRSYTVACAEGEERHVLGLGKLINNKLATMGDMAGQSETRMLLFASLLLADELHEVNGGPPPVNGTGAPAASGHAPQLDALATRLENLAARLEG